MNRSATHPPANLVYLLDDDPGMLKALSRLLRAHQFEVRTFTSVFAFLEAWPSEEVACLVLDVAMPELDGLELQRELNRRGTPIPIVFLTGRGDIPMSVTAIKAGAVDFLTKPVEDAILVRAVSTAMERAVLQGAMHARLKSLTPRERQVMQHVVAGKLNKQIAAELGTGEQNIKLHRAHVMEKMGVDSLAELVRIAERLGL